MPITRRITSAISRSITSAVTEGAGGFHPASLFSGGIKGLALDLTDMSALYQDSARTTLVTATGQPIGSPTDLSGNGAHPVQATAGSRPTFDGYATFDGTDDNWATPSIDFSGTNKVTVIAGVRKSSDAATAVVVELSATASANNGAFLLLAPPGAASPSYTFRSRGTVAADAQSATSYAAPHMAVVSGAGDIAADSAIVRVNGVQTSVATDQGTGNFGNYPIYIGRRGGTTLPFNGRIYRLIVIGRVLSAAELASAERWCAAAVGVSF